MITKMMDLPTLIEAVQDMLSMDLIPLEKARELINDAEREMIEIMTGQPMSVENPLRGEEMKNHRIAIYSPGTLQERKAVLCPLSPNTYCEIIHGMCNFCGHSLSMIGIPPGQRCNVPGCTVCDPPDNMIQGYPKIGAIPPGPNMVKEIIKVATSKIPKQLDCTCETLLNGHWAGCPLK